jgi:fructokinase
MSQPRILALGEVLWDLFPDGARFGGAPANFACHAADEGADVSILSCVGTDQRGDEALTILTKFGVDVSLVQRCSAFQTGAVEVSVDECGHPRFVILPDAAWDHIQWNESWNADRPHYGAVCFGTLGQRESTSRVTIQRLLKSLDARTRYRVVDINLRSPFSSDQVVAESISLANVLKLSDEELPTVSRVMGVHMDGSEPACLKAILAKTDLSYVAMTRGAKGALLVSRNEVIEQTGFAVDVQDTVGAG